MQYMRLQHRRGHVIRKWMGKRMGSATEAALHTAATPCSPLDGGLQADTLLVSTDAQPRVPLLLPCSLCTPRCSCAPCMIMVE